MGRWFGGQSRGPSRASARASVGVGEVYDFYVDPGAGSDAADGSLATPWATLAKVGASTFTPGQRIGLKRGGVWNEHLVVPSSGTSGSPIEIGAYGFGPRPLIDGATTFTGWTEYVPTGEPVEVIQNGGFDTWSNAANAPELWAKFQPGGSTMTRVASITGSGIYSMRLTGDASNTNVSASQTGTLTAGTEYTLSVTGHVSTAGRTGGVVLSVQSGTYAGYQLQPDGTWSTVTSTSSIEVNSTTLSTPELTFTMLPETTTVIIGPKRINLTSAWAEFDDISLLSGVPAVPPVNTYQVPAPSRVWSVSRDDVFITEGSSRDTLEDGEYKWVSGVLYVRDDTGTPNAFLYEGSVDLAHAVTVQGKPHVSVRDVAARHITGRVFRADEGSHFAIFQRLSVRHSGRSDQTGSYGGALAIRNSDDCQVLDSEVYGADNDGVHGWNATRIKVLWNNLGVSTGPLSDNIQLACDYYDNPTTIPARDQDAEIGWNICDQRGTNSPKGNIIVNQNGGRVHHNRCYGGNFQVALAGSRHRADHNTLIDSYVAETWGAAVHMSFGIPMDDIEIDHNLIINPRVGIRSGDNTVVGADKTNLREHHNTIVLTGASAGGIWHDTATDGETTDNIIWGASTGPAILHDSTAGTWVSNRNVVGPERAGFLEIGGAGHNTLAAWQAATSQDAASSTTDPALDADYVPTAGLVTAGHVGDA